MDTRKDVAALVGRILLAFMFALGGYSKIGGYDGTAGYMASAGLPMVAVLLPLTILVEFGGGIALIIGWKARWVALALAIFTVLASVAFHNFWAMAPDLAIVNTLLFNKNMAIVGGMLMVFAFGPGRFSVDRG
ncbi:MAG: DoxX family protein [Betaproteobacteria bacterium]